MTETPVKVAEETPVYTVEQGWLDALVWAIIWRLVRLYYQIYHRRRVFGLQNIPADGPVVIASNHTSHLDPPLIATAQFRRLRFMAKAELFDVPVLGWFIKRLGATPIKRGASDRHAIRLYVQMLRDGQAVLMFPEGTRSRDGKLQESQTGISMILNQVPDTTIVPAFCRGSYEALGPKKKFPSPTKIQVSFGKPFKLSDLGELPTVKKQLYQEIGKEIMNRIAGAESPR